MPNVSNFALRVAALHEQSKGMNAIKVAERFGVSVATIRVWTQKSNVRKGSNMTLEEVEAAVQEWGATPRKRNEANAKGKASAIYRKRLNVKKFGPTKEDNESALSLFKDLADPDACQEAFEQYYRQIAAKLDRETTMEGQISTMTAAIVLVQLRNAVSSCPRINSWADFKIANDILRKSMGMDDKEGGMSKGADLRILNGVVSKSKVVDAEVA